MTGVRTKLPLIRKHSVSFIGAERTSLLGSVAASQQSRGKVRGNSFDSINKEQSSLA